MSDSLPPKPVHGDMRKFMMSMLRIKKHFEANGTKEYNDVVYGELSHYAIVHRPTDFLVLMEHEDRGLIWVNPFRLSRTYSSEWKKHFRKHRSAIGVVKGPYTLRAHDQLHWLDSEGELHPIEEDLVTFSRRKKLYRLVTPGGVVYGDHIGIMRKMLEVMDDVTGVTRRRSIMDQEAVESTLSDHFKKILDKVGGSTNTKRSQV